MSNKDWFTTTPNTKSESATLSKLLTPSSKRKPGSMTAGVYSSLPTVYFIRHGQSVYNAMDELKYSLPRGSIHPCTDIRSVDAPLTLLGRKQALQARSKMYDILHDSNQSIDLVISSPLTRAIQTAMLIFNGSDGCESQYNYVPQNYDKHDNSIMTWLNEYSDTVQYDRSYEILLSASCAENLGCACDIGSSVSALQSTFNSAQHNLNTSLISSHRESCWWFKSDVGLNNATAPLCEPMKRFDIPSQQIKITREPAINLDNRIINFMNFLRSRTERVIAVVAHYTIINRITQQHLHNCDIVKLDWSASKLQQLSLHSQPTIKSFITTKKELIQNEIKHVKCEHHHTGELPISDIADINTDIKHRATHTHNDTSNNNVNAKRTTTLDNSTLDVPDLPTLEQESADHIVAPSKQATELQECTVIAQVKDRDQLQFITDYINNTTTLKQYYKSVDATDYTATIAHASAQSLNQFQLYLTWQSIYMPVQLTELQRRDIIALSVTNNSDCNISNMLAQSIANECDIAPTLIDEFQLNNHMYIVLACNTARIPGSDIPLLDKELEQLVELINQHVATHPLVLHQLTVVDRIADKTSQVLL